MLEVKDRRLPALFLVAIACAGISTGAPAPVYRERGKTERDHILGTWKQVSVESEGVDRSAAEEPIRLHWVIKPNTITLFTKGKRNSGSWTYKLNSTQKPATLDLTVVGGHANGETYPSICQLEGDRLTVLLQSFPKLGRPLDFLPRKARGVGRHVFVRVKSGEVE